MLYEESPNTQITLKVYDEKKEQGVVHEMSQDFKNKEFKECWGGRFKYPEVCTQELQKALERCGKICSDASGKDFMPVFRIGANQ